MNLNPQDLLQWATILGAFCTIWFSLKSRDKERDELTRWRTNIERDIKAANERFKHHEEHDQRIFGRLENIDSELKEIGERLIRIESKMNGK